jgi:hypothetical protein
MPSAIPSGATAQLPPARMIDPRGHRFGAATSAALLALAYIVDAPFVVLLALISIGISAAFGLRYSIYGIIWRRIVRLAHLGPTELEHEYPPRFAQVLGSTVLTLGVVAFLLGLPAAGWACALAVAALQSLLGLTGYCLGCRLYFLRWWVPDLVTRMWSRSQPRRALQGSKISYR